MLLLCSVAKQYLCNRQRRKSNRVSRCYAMVWFVGDRVNFRRLGWCHLSMGFVISESALMHDQCHRQQSLSCNTRRYSRKQHTTLMPCCFLWAAQTLLHARKHKKSADMTPCAFGHWRPVLNTRCLSSSTWYQMRPTSTIRKRKVIGHKGFKQSWLLGFGKRCPVLSTRHSSSRSCLHKMQNRPHNVLSHQQRINKLCGTVLSSIYTNRRC